MASKQNEKLRRRSLRSEELNKLINGHLLQVYSFKEGDRVKSDGSTYLTFSRL